MGKEAYLVRMLDDYYQSCSVISMFLGRRSSEMIRSALLGSPSVWITKDFERCTRDQRHQDKIRILSVDHLELLDAVLKNLERPKLKIRL